MENWNSFALPHVYEGYLGQTTPEAAHPTAPTMPTGELFHLALMHYSAQRHTAPVMRAPQPMAPVAPSSASYIVPAASGSIVSIVYGFLRGRRPRA